MLCAHCFGARLTHEGHPDNIWELPAAVVVHHGESLCRACFSEALAPYPEGGVVHER